jgi:hypothetical protein
MLGLAQRVDNCQYTGWLVPAVVRLILDQIRTINQAFTRIATRVAAGTYSPRRRSGPPKPSVQRKSPGKRKLPQGFAWLRKLVPEVGVLGSQLQIVLADPEIAAVIAAAPASLRRPIRSLCRMLGTDPPPILALPPRPRPKKPAREKARKRPAEQRPKAPTRVRYVGGLRYPDPFPKIR